MYIFTCKDCPNRNINCHSTCEKYLKEKEEYKKLKDNIHIKEELYRYTKEEKYKKLNKQVRKYGKTYV